MKSIAIALFAAASLVAAGAAYAQEDLAKANGCLNCHKGDKDLKTVMAKHKGKPDQIQAAITKVTSGKGHMAVKAKPEDVKAIVEWAAK